MSKMKNINDRLISNGLLFGVAECDVMNAGREMIKHKNQVRSAV